MNIIPSMCALCLTLTTNNETFASSPPHYERDLKLIRNIPVFRCTGGLRALIIFS